MPHLESLVQDCGGSKCFANIDFTHGYWKIPLDKPAQDITSIQKLFGIYSPTGTLKGGTDSGNLLQSVTREKFEGKVQRMLQWLDDFLTHAEDEEELLSDIITFLEVWAEAVFKVNPKKSCFFIKKVKFCRRIISSEGVQFDPRSFEAVVAMKPPRMENELQKL